jgi:hypothetical protein
VNGILSNLPVIATSALFWTVTYRYVSSNYQAGIEKYIAVGNKPSTDYLFQKIVKKNPKQAGGISIILTLIYLSSVADKGKLGTIRSYETEGSSKRKKSIG